MNGSGIAVALDRITKTYPGVIANADVSLSVRRGTVHAVVGENGAGKSTLMRILYGATKPDAGTIRVAGEPIVFGSPADAIGAGIAMVFQHFKLAENLSVLDNVILGAEPMRGRRPGIDRDLARTRILDLAEQYGLPVDPDAMVRDLGVGVRQRVELVKALYRGATTLILDEPTALLTVQEAADLMRQLRDLCRQGLTVIFISHHLDEVLAVSDHVTVMRSGRVVADTEPGEMTASELAVLMVGSSPAELPRRQPRGRTEPVLAMRGVQATGLSGTRLTGVDLQVGAGEIVGVAGVEGNGQDELVDAVLGVLDLSAGRVELAGTDLAGVSTAERRRRGIGCIPQDRQREALVLDRPLWQSQLLGHGHDPRMTRGQFVKVARVRELAASVVAASDVRTPSVDTPASALSGGNQQKFIVGREVEAEPELMLAAQPTRGVDVHAQRQIWSRLIEAAEAGMAMLVISADLDELITLSDRIVVLVRGAVAAEFDGATATRESIGEAMLGGIA
ncbi:ABC transporter ATP-binding protein [uncultured Aeromicrobium sp.]|uniref:ABC transporter ATP-binding protein n=1 Tax=uncultured Aeromicrobium sp. TaxID=337820 RepID=UPI0025D917BC|nr:ABC transporter ATP-binding protein [uncultured Aeromicrobium sp.]